MSAIRTGTSGDITLKGCRDGCVETTVDGRQGSYCLNIVTHRFATAAHDTFIHVTDDGRRTVYLKGGLFSLIPYFTDTQVVGYCLQFAISVAATGKATGRMVGQNQFHHCLPGIHYPGSMGPYNHSFRTFHLTGRGQVTAAFNFHYTDTAGAGIVLVMQIFEFHMTKCRDTDSHALCCVEDGSTFRDFHFSVIYC